MVELERVLRAESGPRGGGGVEGRDRFWDERLVYNRSITEP